MQALRILVVVMGVMIVLGMTVIAVTLAKRAGLWGGVDNGTPAAATAQFGTATVPLPPGTRLDRELVVGETLVLKALGREGETTYLVLDLDSGTLRGSLRVVEAP